MGEIREKIYASFKIEEITYDSVVKAFTQHFAPKTNVIFERARFNRHTRYPEKSVLYFIIDLFTLAETCNYSTLKDELIGDRIVMGITDHKLSERLQLDESLT